MASRSRARLRWHGLAVQRQVLRAVDEATREAAELMRADVVASFRPQPRATSQGRVRGLDPSAPGEPPKIVTGDLRKSIATVIRRRPAAVEALVGTNVHYAPHLEFGAPRRGLAPRPFMRPALARIWPVYRRLAATKVERALGRGTR